MKPQGAFELRVHVWIVALASVIPTGCAFTRASGGCIEDTQCTGGRECYWLASDPAAGPLHAKCLKPPDRDWAIICPSVGMCGYDDRDSARSIPDAGASDKPRSDRR